MPSPRLIPSLSFQGAGLSTPPPLCHGVCLITHSVARYLNQVSLRGPLRPVLHPHNGCV